MYSLRLFAVRHARSYEILYNLFDPLFEALEPLWRKLGYERVEKPVAALEASIKGLLFDCRMCGRCLLSSTGMACPMNCPKVMRNGPCGGVRPNGNCEIEAEMRCVWVEAWEGSQKMRAGDAIDTVQIVLDQDIQGTSSWLRLVREKHTQTDAGTASEAVK